MLGSRSDEVMKLQQALNNDSDTAVALSGAGSKGNETTFFGPATKAAVAKFQVKYGISPAAGYFGPLTRAKMNSLFASAPVTPVNPPVVPGTPSVPQVPVAAGSLRVTAASLQPANSLAPLSATRIPFTKFTITAGATDVPLSSVTVERTGTSVSSALDSVVLLDENGDQIGIAKTLNSVNRAMVGDPIVIKAGTSRTFTIGANRPSAQVAGTGGTVISLDLVAVNTTAVVAGDALPIRGATHTINDNLVIGTVRMARGGIDPGADQNKEIGVTGYTFSSVKVEAGPAEAMTLKSIRWNQVESAGIADLANLKTYVDGVAYDAVSTDGGRYYTSTFGNGILIDKGFSKDISIKGDIIGGSARKARFDIAKRTDINLVGNVYGFGILPPQSANCGTVSCFTTSEDPWYKGSTVTMNNGTMTVSSDNTVSAQNIAVNLMNQPLGGWSVEVRGEPISIAKMVFDVTVVGDLVSNITNVVLVDANGSVLAGPVDGVGAGTGTFTFTDTVTLPTGVTKLALKGKLGNTYVSNDTVIVSSNPQTQWTTARGQVTGNSITPAPNSILTGSTMTVKSGALAISVSSQPVAQNVIAGANQFEFARYVFDAGQSGEEVRITSIPLLLAVGAPMTASNLSSCTLYDGNTALVTGGNVVNPSVVGDISFTFDGTGLMIPKGTSKNISLKCNVAAGVTGTVAWGLTNNSAVFSGASGMMSGQTVTETMIASAGQTMTLAASGTYLVSGDSSSAYNYRAVRAGTEVALAAYRFTATANEDITIRQISLELGNIASSSSSDLAGEQVTLWDGATLVGVGQFTTSAYATSTLTAPFVVPKNGVKTLVVKGTLSAQDAVNGTPGAFLAINYDGDNNGLNGNYGTGKDSGVTIPGVSADILTSGVRIFRNVPTFQVISAGGSFQNNVDTYKFTVTNPTDRNMALSQVTFDVATTGGAASNFTLYANGAAVNAGNDNPVGNELKIVFAANNDGKIIPANSSKTYVLRCANLVDVAGISETLSIALKADASYPSLAGLMGTVAQLTAGSKTVWSPMSTTVLEANDPLFEVVSDWTNGYGLPGFPAIGSDFPIQVWTRSN